MLIAIPAAIGMIALAKPIMQLLFPQKDTLELAAKLLAMIAVTVVFYSLSTLSNGILQGIGKVNLPVRNAAIALAVQTLIVLLIFTELDLYALVICLIVYSFMMCVLNSISMRRYIGVKEDMKTMFFLPLAAACVMGLCAKGAYMILQIFVNSNVVCLVPSIMISVIVYVIIILKIGAVDKEQLLGFPKGKRIVLHFM